MTNAKNNILPIITHHTEMQFKYISRNKPQCRRLILIYAGWAMDWRPFKGLAADGYDVMVVWDYRELTFNWKPLLKYDEICLLAWSMGVFAASVTVHEILPRITKRIAVNGTLHPIHDRMGIPETIFSGTVAGLSPTNMRKFYRRMCLTAGQFEWFKEHKPQRDFEEMRQELTDIETHSLFHVAQVEDWDLAVVGRHDTIFPASNQINAWRGQGTPVQLMEAAHLPDFGLLLKRLFINKELVSRRFTASQSTYGNEAVVQRDIAARLWEALQGSLHGRELTGNVVEVGVGDGQLTRLYAPMRGQGTLQLWDIADVDTETIGRVAPDARVERCDAEVRIRRMASESAMYILSASTLQWFNSPQSFLRECGRVLAPGGMLAVSTFVHGNVEELNQVLGTGLQLPTPQAWLGMLPPELEVTWQMADVRRLTFDSPREVLRHLSQTGVNAVSYGRNPTVLARKMLQEYPRDAEGRCTLTYRPFYFVARKVEQ